MIVMLAAVTRQRGTFTFFSGGTTLLHNLIAKYEAPILAAAVLLWSAVASHAGGPNHYSYGSGSNVSLNIYPWYSGTYGYIPGLGYLAETNVPIIGLHISRVRPVLPPPPSAVDQPYQLTEPPLADNLASVLVTVPDPDTEVWINGTKTVQKGLSREFVSPALTPGRDFQYEIRAQWMENGNPVTQSTEITVHGGERVKLLFPAASEQRMERVPEGQ